MSFVVSAILLKSSKAKDDEEGLEGATRRMQDMKAQSKGVQAANAAAAAGDLSTVRKIIVACDAGMGSSAMGPVFCVKSTRCRAETYCGDQLCNQQLTGRCGSGDHAP